MSLINRILLKLKSRLNYLNAINTTIRIPESSKIVGSLLKGEVTISDNCGIAASDLKGKISIGNFSSIKNSTLNGEIEIGAHNKILGATLLGKIKTGNFTSFWGPNIDIHSNQIAGVEIGNFCSIARNVSFQSFNHNFKKPTSYFIGQNLFKEKWENEKVYKGNINLENDVWIGAHSVILGGITIENGAVVAANSVVTKSVPAFAIVAGSPAKVIGYRFEPHIINQFQELAWWNWSMEKIKKNKSFFEQEVTEASLNHIIHD
jgi:acetyltransferase-like isoleucine patch superfamily enzyme